MFKPFVVSPLPCECVCTLEVWANYEKENNINSWGSHLSETCHSHVFFSCVYFLSVRAGDTYRIRFLWCWKGNSFHLYRKVSGIEYSSKGNWYYNVSIEFILFLQKYMLFWPFLHLAPGLSGETGERSSSSGHKVWSQAGDRPRGTCLPCSLTDRLVHIHCSLQVTVSHRDALVFRSAFPSSSAIAHVPDLVGLRSWQGPAGPEGRRAHPHLP